LSAIEGTTYEALQLTPLDIGSGVSG